MPWGANGVNAPAIYSYDSLGNDPSGESPLHFAKFAYGAYVGGVAGADT